MKTRKGLKQKKSQAHFLQYHGVFFLRVLEHLHRPGGTVPRIQYIVPSRKSAQAMHRNYLLLLNGVDLSATTDRSQERSRSLSFQTRGQMDS